MCICVYCMPVNLFLPAIDVRVHTSRVAQLHVVKTQLVHDVCEYCMPPCSVNSLVFRDLKSALLR